MIWFICSDTPSRNADEGWRMKDGSIQPPSSCSDPLHGILGVRQGSRSAIWSIRGSLGRLTRLGRGPNFLS